MWLITQDSSTPLEPAMRPDRCGVIFTTPDQTPDVMVHTTHQGRNAYELPNFRNLLVSIVGLGRKVIWTQDNSPNKIVFDGNRNTLVKQTIRMGEINAMGIQRPLSKPDTSPTTVPHR
jgi:hypothetical protein